MNEDIFAAIFLFDKAEAFGVIEPFNGAFSHNYLSPWNAANWTLNLWLTEMFRGAA